MCDFCTNISSLLMKIIILPGSYFSVNISSMFLDQMLCLRRKGPFVFRLCRGNAQFHKRAHECTSPRKVNHVTSSVELHFKFQCALLDYTKEPEEPQELITRFTVSRRSPQHQQVPGKTAECPKKSQRSVLCFLKQTSCSFLGLRVTRLKITLANGAKLALLAC